MGWPYDTGSSFVRHPGGYAHDAFGHTGADDAGIRAACFRKIPHTGIDVSSKTPSTNKAGQRRTPVVSPISGTIVRAGSDPEAGLHHIIKHDDFEEWWIGGHHSAFERTSGHVERGDVIARMGDTGGAQGIHTHWTVATSLAAALAYVSGWVQYRNDRSVAAWARQAIRGTDQRFYGLVDPWPLIEREWADEKRRLAAIEQDQLDKERAAAAAAQAAAEAEAAAKAREQDMKTRKIRIGQDIFVSCVADDFLWHVPNTKALPAADVMVDEPSEPPITLSKEAAAALFNSMKDGRNAEKIAAHRKRLIGS